MGAYLSLPESLEMPCMPNDVGRPGRRSACEYGISLPDLSVRAHPRRRQTSVYRAARTAARTSTERTPKSQRANTHTWETRLVAQRKDGGEGGIRTPVPLTGQDAFEAPPLRPLRYLSAEAGCAEPNAQFYLITGDPLRALWQPPPATRARLCTSRSSLSW